MVVMERRKELKIIFDKFWEDSVLNELKEFHQIRLEEMKLNLFYQLENVEVIA